MEPDLEYCVVATLTPTEGHPVEYSFVCCAIETAHEEYDDLKDDVDASNVMLFRMERIER